MLWVVIRQLRCDVFQLSKMANWISTMLKSKRTRISEICIPNQVNSFGCYLKHNILSLVYFSLFVQSINESISLLRANSHPAQLIGFYDTRNAVHSTYFKWLGNRINGPFEVFLSSAHTPSVGDNKSEILYWLSFITAQWQQEMKWN